MLESIAPYLTYSIALTIAAVIPGPGIAALVGQSLGGNSRASFFFLGGIALGDVTYLSIAIIGLAAVVQAFSAAFIVIKILGAAYLLFLAYSLWHSNIGLAKINKQKERTGRQAFIAGYMVTLGNPKTIVFYLALLPTVLNLSAVNFFMWFILAVLTAVIIFVSLTPYAVMAAKARTMMTQPRALERLNRLAASAIGGAGIIVLGQATVAVFRRT